MHRALHHLRTHARLTAWLGLLLLCLQVWAVGAGQRHELQRLTAGSNPLLVWCSTAASADASGNPGRSDDSAPANTSCAICLSAMALALPPAPSVAHGLPAFTASAAPLTRIVSATPRAPDLRHAPNRAPPFLA
jgi:hypothetical protein